MTNAVLYSTHYSKLLSLTETFYSPSFGIALLLTFWLRYWFTSIPQSEPNPIKKNNKNTLQVLFSANVKILRGKLSNEWEKKIINHLFRGKSNLQRPKPFRTPVKCLLCTNTKSFDKLDPTIHCCNLLRKYSVAYVLKVFSWVLKLIKLANECRTLIWVC